MGGIVNFERGYILRVVHRHVLENDGNSLDQSRAALAAIRYLFLAAVDGSLGGEDQLPPLQDATAEIFQGLGEGLLLEATADLPPERPRS